jgi:hypothetical protein
MLTITLWRHCDCLPLLHLSTIRKSYEELADKLPALLHVANLCILCGNKLAMNCLTRQQIGHVGFTAKRMNQMMVEDEGEV